MLRWEPKELAENLSGLIELQRQCGNSPPAQWPAPLRERAGDILRRALPLLGATSLQLFGLRSELQGQSELDWLKGA